MVSWFFGRFFRTTTAGSSRVTSSKFCRSWAKAASGRSGSARPRTSTETKVRALKVRKLLLVTPGKHSQCHTKLAIMRSFSEKRPVCPSFYLIPCNRIPTKFSSDWKWVVLAEPYSLWIKLSCWKSQRRFRPAELLIISVSVFSKRFWEVAIYLLTRELLLAI